LSWAAEALENEGPTLLLLLPSLRHRVQQPPATAMQHCWLDLEVCRSASGF